MANLERIQDNLSLVIDYEILTFLEYFNESFRNTVPLLMFPMQLGKIITKCIRYHAAIYGIVAFYVEMNGKLFIVLCHQRHLKPYYQHIYRQNFCCSQEDSEIIYPYKLFTSIQVNIASLASRRKRRTFGLDLPGFADNAIANSSTISTNYSAIFDPDMDERESSQIVNTKPEIFLDEVKNNLNVFPSCKPYPLLTDLPVIQSTIDTAFEEHQSKEITKPTCDSSSSVQKLNLVPSETAPVFASEGTIAGFGNQSFKFMHFMDNVLECGSNLPLFVQARHDYEPFSYITRDNLNTIVELYDIPGYYRTIDLLNVYNFGPRFIKWCDDTHALLIYVKKDHADMALLLDHFPIRARPMTEASPISTVVACMMDFPTVLQHLRNKQRKFY